MKARRFGANPILRPNLSNAWEALAAFNGCPVESGETTYLLYRAISKKQKVEGVDMNLSTIGVAESDDRIHFDGRRQLIYPTEEWEKFGCEDPRVVFLDGAFYIFYTAISQFPPNAESIKVAVAISRDMKTIQEKHLVTPFNAKAMSLFPDKVGGKYAAILTVDTDTPPAKIAIAMFDRLEQLWDESFWNNWYAEVDRHLVALLRSGQDHIEVGAPPVKLEQGWLLIYSYIKNYFSSQKVFGIEAALLDIVDPKKKIGATDEALIQPQEEYEIHGEVENIVFPSGALVHNDELGIYYGAADTSCCLATVGLGSLLGVLDAPQFVDSPVQGEHVSFLRYSKNPIISPIHEHEWESKFTLNAGAILEAGKVHILYRAQGSDDTSVLGYAASSDGFNIDKRLAEPAYVPREDFEIKQREGFSGCEDPRITKLGDKFYMCYTGFDGVNSPRVALTSISVADFLKNKWDWEKPVLISPPKEMDKNACVLPDKIDGRYGFYHRIGQCIWFDLVDDLNFSGVDNFLMGKIVLEPRANKWDSLKIGIGPVPIKTQKGWLMIYHGLSDFDNKYRLGAALFDLKDPTKLLRRLEYPILEPVENYENIGLRKGTVFSCGAVEINGQIFLYYGGADQFVSVAVLEMEKLLGAF